MIVFFATFSFNQMIVRVQCQLKVTSRYPVLRCFDTMGLKTPVINCSIHSSFTFDVYSWNNLERPRISFHNALTTIFLGKNLMYIKLVALQHSLCIPVDSIEQGTCKQGPSLFLSSYQLKNLMLQSLLAIRQCPLPNENFIKICACLSVSFKTIITLKTIEITI